MDQQTSRFYHKTSNFRTLKERILDTEQDVEKQQDASEGQGPVKSKFIFVPHQPISKQISKFQASLKNDTWNKEILFLGFKGAFKIEYWNIFEEAKRSVIGLNKLSFVDTKVDIPHLTLLKSLIQWLNPKEIALKFIQNELDDKDLEIFLDKGILHDFGRKIQSILIISNPGIYKGHFVSRLKRQLAEMTKIDLQYNFHLIKNKKFKSIGYIRILKNLPSDEVEDQISQVHLSLKVTFYYKLSFKHCFSAINQTAFQYLIEQTYHEDKLEQIEYLDVGDCVLGAHIVLEKICSRLSASKGLLNLGLQGIKHLKEVKIWQSMMGDRYDQLRLNHIDINDNGQMLDKCVNILAEKLMSKSLKSIGMRGLLVNPRQDIIKIIHIIEAFTNEIEELEKLMKEEKFIPKLSLKILDLSTIDNFYRTDLVKALLISIVLSEFSNCQELTIQNLESAPLVSYFDALNQFEAHIMLMKKINPLYTDFTPKLRCIKMNVQTNPMDENEIDKLFERFFFTKSTNLLNIQSVCLYNKSLQQDTIQLGFKQFLLSLNDEFLKEPDTCYTLKHFTMQDTKSKDSDIFSHLFQNVLFNEHFKIESFILKNEIFDNKLGCKFLNYADMFIKSIPIGTIWSLNILILMDIKDSQIDILKLVELMVFNDKVNIQELRLMNIDLLYDEESMNHLIERAKRWKNLLPLKKLHIGGFTNGNNSTEKTLIQVLIIQPMNQIDELLLKTPNIKNQLKIFKEKITDYKVHALRSANQLKSLILDGIEDYSATEWEHFADIFIFGNTIHSLEFRNITISTALAQGLHKCNDKKQEYHIHNVQSLKSAFSLQSLIFENCTFQDEIFSLLFSADQSNYQILHVVDCKDLDIAVKAFQQTYIALQEFLDHINIAIHDLVLDGTKLLDKELFQWFFQEIIFNTKKQKLKYLSMKNCELEDYNFIIINNLIKDMKAFHHIDKHKGYFSLRQFFFDGNQGISSKSWRDLFDNLFTVYNASEGDQVQFDDQQDEETKISEEEQKTQDQINEIDKKTDEIVQYIINSQLSIPDKILANPKMYPINPPIQLNRLELIVLFKHESPQVKQRLYNTIFSSLVFYPGSQLKELSLTDVDLSMFIISTEMNIQINNEILLQKLQLINILNGTKQLMTDFSKLYFQNDRIYLKEFIMDSAPQGEFYNDISNCIEQLLRSGHVFIIHNQRLRGVHSNLTIKQTLQFFKTVIFNKNIPLMNIELGEQVIFQSEEDFLNLIDEHMQNQNYICLIRDFIWTTAGDQQTLDTLTRLFPIIIEGIDVKLDKFCLRNLSNKEFNLFQNIVDQSQLDNFTITDLTLDYYMDMNLEEFKFLYYVRPKLQKLNLGQLSTQYKSSNEINTFLGEQHKSSRNQRFFRIMSRETPCVLKLNFRDNFGDGVELMKYFVFGKAFQWQDIIMVGYDHVVFVTDCCIKNKDVLRFLRYLKLDLKNSHNSHHQISDICLKIIGDQLIYDERFMLEELCLIDCDLKLPGIKALTSGAQAFRNRVEESKSQQKTQLKLKRFTIHYSLNITNEGAEMINKDIIFFEFITIQRIELYKVNWNNEMSISHCHHGKAWLQYQKRYKRQKPYFSIKIIDWGGNELIQSKEAWFLLCETFLFSNNTPLLQVLSINNMSLTNQQIDWICEKADDYFRWKAFNYVHPLKRLNFSNNPALSDRGWQKVSKKFFFSSYINLEEINLTGTMDSQVKLDAVSQAGLYRASQKRSKKLTLHTLLCDNVELKQLFSLLMRKRPILFQPIQDSSEVTLQCYENGDIEGYFESFGKLLSITTKILYQEKFITNFKWTDQTKMRFSSLHLNVAPGLLRPLRDFFKINIEHCGYFPIDLKTCDQLCTLFKYNQITGSAYPYQLLFTPDAISFYMEPQCNIKVINFIGSTIKNAEQMDQFQIFELWKILNSTQCSLDVVYIDYKLNDDLVEFMISLGYNERDIVNLIRMFPPSQMRLCDTLTLQALKGIYSIMCDNHQFNYADIIYDKHIFLNVGIGYSIREYVYRTNPTNFFGRALKYISYHGFSLFVNEVEKYQYTAQIKNLNNFLSTQRLYYIIFSFLTIVYLIICTLGPYGWQHYYVGDDDFAQICSKNISPLGIYNYLVFAFFSFIAEAYLYWKVTQVIPDHIKSFIDIDEQDGEDRVNEESSSICRIHPLQIQNKDIESPPKQNRDSSVFMFQPPKEEEIGMIQTMIVVKSTKKSNTIDTLSNDLKKMTNILQSDLNNFAKSKTGRILGYIKDLTLGQLVKFHLYTNVNFILTCYYCQYHTLAILALMVSVFSVFQQLYALSKFILKQCFQDNKSGKHISTQYINDFFEISQIGQNMALSTILDSVAPYNITIIPSNFITRALVPLIAGKSISNSVKGYILTFVFEDIPQILLQTYFVVNRALSLKGSLSITIYITIINTGISLITSFMKFMSIRPSSISQADFDELATTKTSVFMDGQLGFIDQEKKILEGISKDI